MEMNTSKMTQAKFFIFCLFILITTTPLYSQETRRIQPIRTPAYVSEPLAEGVEQIKTPIPVDRQVVEKTMEAIAASWNTSNMTKTLSKDFYEKDRLMDTMTAKAPVDAKLRIISIGSYNVLNQGVKKDSDGDLLISRVSVTAKTQIEYNDPKDGFQRREGEQEYIIKIMQRIKR
ncbi:MAG: hypothetical protein N3D15_09995 [Syntrophorhabdaceae bacterium]|nr:hypothetical protein [Syntrophorhabdaceae bacterium]